MANLRRDVYGRTVQVGDFVTVNYSGYLAIGEVKRFAKEDAFIEVQITQPQESSSWSYQMGYNVLNQVSPLNLAKIRHQVIKMEMVDFK